AVSFGDMAVRSAQVAGFLASRGVAAGDRILIMLPNCVPLWETLLAAIRLGAVIIPATTLLEGNDLRVRLRRAKVKAVVTDVGLTDGFVGFTGVPLRVCVDGTAAGWIPYADTCAQVTPLHGSAATRADDLLFLYFTSGTTARPKLVAHT